MFGVSCHINRFFFFICLFLSLPRPSFEVYEGECLRTVLRLTAAGQHGVWIHGFKVSHPACVVLGSPQELSPIAAGVISAASPEPESLQSPDRLQQQRDSFKYDWETGLVI